jgi:alpha-L-rhamnosidase
MDVTVQIKPILASLLLAAGDADATKLPAAPTSAWSAQWIGPAEAGPNTWTCYRKSFVLQRVPATAPTRIAVDSKYWLWVNGQLVVREGGLKRGPTPTDTYYDALDLAPALVKGSNTVAVLVWYFRQTGILPQP